MFLQKYRYEQERSLMSPVKKRGGQKLTEVLKRISATEIKKHEPRLNLTARDLLIDSTTKVLKTPKKAMNEINIEQTFRKDERRSAINEDSFRKSKEEVRMTSREARTAAVKAYRHKIWKSSDISELIKANEQRLSQTKFKDKHNKQKQVESDEKVERYRDFIDKLEQQTEKDQKERIRNQWMKEAMKNNSQARTNTSNRNPEQLQITNIQFMQQTDKNYTTNSSRLLINRERRKEMRRVYHFNYHQRQSQQKQRPNTTGAIHRQKSDENIIEPW